MIMMSGEDGSASISNSQINMTQITHQNYPQMVSASANPARIPIPTISPQYNKHNLTNDGANSSIGGNPFATQAMIGLNQMQSSQASQSQSRVYQRAQEIQGHQPDEGNHLQVD